MNPVIKNAQTGYSVVFTVGKYGGFHFHRFKHVTELTLGWVAIEFWKLEVAALIGGLLGVEN